MTDDSRLLAEADRSARAARRATTAGTCVVCCFDYQPGSWVAMTNAGRAHRACLRPAPLESRVKPAKRNRRLTPATVEAARTITATRRGRCAACGGGYYAGESISFLARGKGRPVHAACAPQPLKATPA